LAGIVAAGIQCAATYAHEAQEDDVLLIVAFLILTWGEPIPPAYGAMIRDTTVAPATLVKRVPPRYPAKAIDRGQEGWVDLQFTVTPEGATSGIRVVAAYPRDVFERSAINALGKWTYTPRLENGIPVPQADNRAVLSFALTEAATVRPSTAPLIATASTQIAASDWHGAEETLRALTAIPGLTLPELGKLEQLRGQIAFGRSEFQSAVDFFARALSISARSPAGARAELSQLLVTAAIHAKQFDRAADAFHAWNPADSPQTRQIRRTIEAMRPTPLSHSASGAR
jgi:TonB family protein